MTREQNLYGHSNRLAESIEYYLVYKNEYCLNDLMNDLKHSKKLIKKERNIYNENI